MLLITICASSSSRTVNMKIFAGVADGSVVIFKRNQGKRRKIIVDNLELKHL